MLANLAVDALEEDRFEFCLGEDRAEGAVPIQEAGGELVLVLPLLLGGLHQGVEVFHQVVPVQVLRDQGPEGGDVRQGPVRVLLRRPVERPQHDWAHKVLQESDRGALVEVGAVRGRTEPPEEVNEPEGRLRAVDLRGLHERADVPAYGPQRLPAGHVQAPASARQTVRARPQQVLKAGVDDRVLLLVALERP